MASCGATKRRVDGLNPYRGPRDDALDVLTKFKVRLNAIKRDQLKNPDPADPERRAALEARLVLLEAEWRALSDLAKAFRVGPKQDKPHNSLPVGWGA